MKQLFSHIRFFFPALIGGLVLCLATSCKSVQYEGEVLAPLPANAEITFISDPKEVPVGAKVLGTAECTTRFSESSEEVRELFRSKAREVGANGIHLLKVKKVADGSARTDQLRNSSSPGWNTKDTSDSAFLSAKWMTGYFPDSAITKSVYKTHIQAEFLSFPDSTNSRTATPDRTLPSE